MAEWQDIVLMGLKGLGEVLMFCVLAVYYWCELAYKLIFPPEKKSLDGEIFLITGSSTGIGRQVVLQLAKDHPKTTLVLWDVNTVENKKTADDARALGAKVFTYDVDVSNQEAVDENAKKVYEEVGDVTILFNNAGIARIKEFFKLTPEELVSQFRVNVFAHFWTLRAFMPKMIENNRGHIVTTDSVGAHFSIRYGSAYFASKFAVRGYLEALQDEISIHPSKPDKIKFTTIFPSFVRTALTSNVIVKVKYQDDSQTFLTPEYVASKIIEGIRQNQEKVVIPKYFELLFIMKSLLPHKMFARLVNYIMEGGYKED